VSFLLNDWKTKTPNSGREVNFQPSHRLLTYQVIDCSLDLNFKANKLAETIIVHHCRHVLEIVHQEKSLFAIG
jgi:hypothetical protein